MIFKVIIQRGEDGFFVGNCPFQNASQEVVELAI
jgi:hypothetical protein